MVSRSAGNDRDFIDIPERFIRQVYFIKTNFPVFHTRIDCLSKHARLFFNLLEHEMRIACFFRLGYVPLHRKQLAFNGIEYFVVKLHTVLFHDGNLSIIQEIHIACVFKKRRDIRFDQVFVFSHAHNKRAVFANRDNFLRKAFAYNAQRIASLQLGNRLRHSILQIIL